MQEKYPWDVRENERSVEFFPGYRGGGHLVKPPERPDLSSMEAEDTGFEEYLAEYLRLEAEENGLESLEVLAEMRDEYEGRWSGDDTYIAFFPEGYVPTKVSFPSLSSIASSFNEMDSGEDEREVLREFLDRNYYRTGSLSVSIYTQDDESYILDEGRDSDTRLVPFDHLSEEYPLKDLVDKILKAEDEASSELVDLMWEYYHTGEAKFDKWNWSYSVFHDPLDGTVVLWRVGETDLEFEEEDVLDRLQPLHGGDLYNDTDISAEETIFENLFNPGTFGWEPAGD
ncbi:MAG: hypothetical protein SVQ76_02670 [Candidatus Nanohaloarchaea archaeon]|nr:hypothetical protein [Candidatus Nanohaloarchaea archaeon]